MISYIIAYPDDDIEADVEGNNWGDDNGGGGDDADDWTGWYDNRDINDYGDEYYDDDDYDVDNDDGDRDDDVDNVADDDDDDNGDDDNDNVDDCGNDNYDYHDGVGDDGWWTLGLSRHQYTRTRATDNKSIDTGMILFVSR